MSIIKVDYGTISGGKNSDGYAFTFDATDLINATATSTPIVLKGDFSNVKTIISCGVYYCGNLPAQNALYLDKTENITVSSSGTAITLTTGQSKTSSMWGYRDITIYPDRLEIGSGYYGNHNDDNSHAYGCLQVLTLVDYALYV